VLGSLDRGFGRKGTCFKFNKKRCGQIAVREGRFSHVDQDRLHLNSLSVIKRNSPKKNHIWQRVLSWPPEQLPTAGIQAPNTEQVI
jgi:hypothetical protein